MIELTKKIKDDVSTMVAEGVDGQEILLSLVEGGVVDAEYPQLYHNGTFDEVLDSVIQDTIIQYIEDTIIHLVEEQQQKQ
jgi:hypothetical protein